jgi:steroid delta-isomerase-like uncharacterized protein
MLTESRRLQRLRLVEEHVGFENRHDVDGVLGTFGAAAFYNDEPWRDSRVGRRAVQAYYESVMQALPDMHIEVLRRHVTDDRVILEVRIQGTHLGPWRGLPATGRRVDVPLCGIYEFDEDDRLAGETIYYDRATVLQQLGVFREPNTLAGALLTAVTHPVTILRVAARAFTAPLATPQTPSGIRRNLRRRR